MDPGATCRAVRRDVRGAACEPALYCSGDLFFSPLPNSSFFLYELCAKATVATSLEVEVASYCTSLLPPPRHGNCPTWLHL
jgi:hypothetical protein